LSRRARAHQDSGLPPDRLPDLLPDRLPDLLPNLLPNLLSVAVPGGPDPVAPALSLGVVRSVWRLLSASVRATRDSLGGCRRSRNGERFPFPFVRCCRALGNRAASFGASSRIR